MPRVTLKKQIKLPLIDNNSAPDMFADEAVGFFLADNMMRITFAATKVDHSVASNTKSRVVVGRLLLPLSAAENMQKALAEFIARMKSQSHNPDIGSNTLQ